MTYVIWCAFVLSLVQVVARIGRRVFGYRNLVEPAFFAWLTVLCLAGVALAMDQSRIVDLNSVYEGWEWLPGRPI